MSQSPAVPYIKSKVSLIGKVILEIVDGLGHFTIYVSKVLYWFPRRPWRIKLFFDQMYFIGNKSIFIVVLTSVFSGMVFAYQTYLGFSVINADSLVGPVVAIGIAKELGPVFTGLIVTGRCGAAMAAQIGTMKVTEQVDALEVMGINSTQYLSVPRVAAAVISMPMLACLFLLIANIGSYFIGVEVLKIDGSIYFSKLSDFMELADVAEGLIKATCFGFMISIIGTFHGFNVKGGAEGVGKGTNLAVVWGMIVILVMDFFLTSFLVKILGNG
jgi:phospholipid/cholesterol/gamma-HCH transport system permease protein